MTLRSQSIKVMAIVIAVVIVTALLAVYGYFFNDRLKKYLPEDSYFYTSLKINNGDFQNPHLKKFLTPFVEYQQIELALNGQLNESANRNLGISNVIYNGQKEVVGVAELSERTEFTGFLSYQYQIIKNNVNKRLILIFSSNDELLKKTIEAIDLDRIVIKKINLSSWKSFLSLFTRLQGEAILTKNENLPIILDEIGKLNGKIIFNLEWNDQMLRLFTPGYELKNSSVTKAAAIEASILKDSGLKVFLPELVEKAKISKLQLKSNNNYSSLKSSFYSSDLTLDEALSFFKEKLLLANRQTVSVVLPDSSVIKVIQKDEGTIEIKQVPNGYSIIDLIANEQYLLTSELPGQFNLSKGEEVVMIDYNCQINGLGEYMAIEDPDLVNQLLGFSSKAVISSKPSFVTTYPQISLCLE